MSRRPGAVALLAAAVLTLLAGGTAAAAWTAPASGSSSSATRALAAPSGVTVTQSCLPTSTSTVTFRGSSTLAGVSPLTVPMPAGVKRNDLLLALVSTLGANSAPVTPTGWSVIGAPANGRLRLSSFGSIVTADSPADVAFALATPGQRLAVTLVAYSGVEPSTAVANAFGSAVINGEVATAAALTTTVPNTRLVTMWAFTGDQPLSAPAGMTSRATVHTTDAATPTTNLSLLTTDLPIPAAGSTGSRSVSGTLSSGNLNQTASGVVQIAVRPMLHPQAVVSWTPSSSSWASGYVARAVEAGTEAGSATVAGASTSGATVTPLQPNRTYTIEVRATSGSAWQSAAATASFTTNGAYLSPVTTCP